SRGASPSMIDRRPFARLFCALLLCCAALTVRAQTPAPRVTIGYVEVTGDPRYEPITGFGRLVLKARERPYTGAQVGLDEAQALSRVLKIDFGLERISAGAAAGAGGGVSQARENRDMHFFVVDAPAQALKPLADAIRGRDILAFNVT